MQLSTYICSRSTHHFHLQIGVPEVTVLKMPQSMFLYFHEHFSFTSNFKYKRLCYIEIINTLMNTLEKYNHCFEDTVSNMP